MYLKTSAYRYISKYMYLLYDYFIMKSLYSCVHLTFSPRIMYTTTVLLQYLAAVDPEYTHEASVQLNSMLSEASCDK